MKKYLLFVSHSYSYSILRPIQDEIWKRGDDVAWFVEDSSPLFLRENEKQLKTIQEVMDYNPYAIFAPGNYIYDFFPGIKVEVFHGLYYKRTDYGDHYKIRGFFDIYCTTSGMFTPTFEQLAQKHGFFKVYETGWSKFDSYDTEPKLKSTGQKTSIIYAPTFTQKLNSTDDLYPQIEVLVENRDWDWLFSFHPKMDKETVDKYKALAEKHSNATICDTEDKLPLYQAADVMLSDSSSVIYEFLWFDKPVVTYKNTFPANHLINITQPEQLEKAIETALLQPTDLMENIRKFMDQVHPFRDRKASVRILDAVDDFDQNYKGKIKAKPVNLFRNLKLRKKTHYFPFGKRYKSKTN